MKRHVLSLILALVMAVGLTAPALAATSAAEADILSYEEVIPAQFEEAYYFPRTENGKDAGLAVVKQNGKYGYINTQGEVVIPCVYDVAGAFHEGYAVVGTTFLTGETEIYYELSLVDEAGTNIAFPTPDGWRVLDYSYRSTWDNEWYGPSAPDVWEGHIPLTMYRVKTNPDGSVELVLNSNGTEYESAVRLYRVDRGQASAVSLPPLPGCDSFYAVRIDSVSEGMVFLLIQVMDKNYPIPDRYSTWGGMIPMYCNLETGTYVDLPDEGDDNDFIYWPWGDYGTFNQGLASIQGMNGGVIVIDKEGQLAWDASSYYNMTDFDDNGLAVALVWDGMTQTTSYCVVNKAGEVVIPLEYDDLLPATKGTDRLPFCKDGKWGYLNSAGEVVIPAQYTKVGNFNNIYNCAPVETQDRTYLIDPNGDILLYGEPSDASSESIHLSATNELFPLEQANGTWGYARLVPAASSAPVSATLNGGSEGELTVEYTQRDGKLALAQGAISPGHKVVAALYSAEGRFVGVKVLTAGQSSAQLSGSYASIRLFWLDETLTPVSTPAEMTL